MSNVRSTDGRGTATPPRQQSHHIGEKAKNRQDILLKSTTKVFWQDGGKKKHSTGQVETCPSRIIPEHMTWDGIHTVLGYLQ